MNPCNKCTTCLHSYEPKEISFSELLSQYDLITIPKIQRDYAQGRNDTKATEIRRNLLDQIFSSGEIKFDFIFGTNEIRTNEDGEKNCFIPLDGQQRLTTLFLLYLYDHKMLGKGNPWLSKFTYDTREASKDFCIAIVDDEHKWDKPKEKLSKMLKNKVWFMDYWQYDPTVESMLNMLDAIHEKATLQYPNLDKITFYLFDMNEHKLNESLYLKMNSRGKPLTAFENTKSKIDNMLKEKNIDTHSSCFDALDDDDLNNKNSFEQKWKHCMDRQWSDFFWKYKENYLVDNPFLRFIKICLLNYWIINFEKDEKKTTIDDIMADETTKELFEIKKIGTYVSFSSFEKVLKLKGAFVYLARTLNVFFTQYENVIKKKARPAWGSENYVLGQVLNGKVTYPERVIFYAITVYKDDNYTTPNFKQWMRVVWNIVENANIENISTMISAMRLISDLAEYSHCIYVHLKDKEIKDVFAKEQMKEEKKKAFLLLATEENWTNLFEQAEKFPLLRGRISSLFAKPDSYDVGEEKYEDVKTCWENVNKYFNADGEMNDEYKENATLLKTFVLRSDFWNDLWWHYKIFDNEKGTWRDILKLNTGQHGANWHKAVHEILLGNINIVHNENNHEFHKKLYNTDLLVYISKNLKGCWIRDIHGHTAIYPSAWGVFLDADNRDRVLSCLTKKLIVIEKGNEIPGTSFFHGWDIEFKYNNHRFNWNSDKSIYLMNQNVRAKSSAGEDIKISETEITCENATEKFDELITKYLPLI